LRYPKVQSTLLSAEREPGHVTSTLAAAPAAAARLFPFPFLKSAACGASVPPQARVRVLKKGRHAIAFMLRVREQGFG
jgi:hypothetical protein